MKRPQFSLWWLLGFTTFAATCCLALVNASSAWAMLLHSAVVALLLAAILRAVYRDGAVRAFWMGFSVWGWVYLALNQGGSFSIPAMYVQFNPHDSQLVTTHLLELGYDHLLPMVRTPPQWNGMGGMGGMSGGGMGGGGLGGGGEDLSMLGLPPSSVGGFASGSSGAFSEGQSIPASFYPDKEKFHRVGHELWTFLLAMTGGWVARYLYRTRPSRWSPATL